MSANPNKRETTNRTSSPDRHRLSLIHSFRRNHTGRFINRQTQPNRSTLKTHRNALHHPLISHPNHNHLSPLLFLLLLICPRPFPAFSPCSCSCACSAAAALALALAAGALPAPLPFLQEARHVLTQHLFLLTRGGSVNPIDQELNHSIIQDRNTAPPHPNPDRTTQQTNAPRPTPPGSPPPPPRAPSWRCASCPPWPVPGSASPRTAPPPSARAAA